VGVRRMGVTEALLNDDRHGGFRTEKTCTPSPSSSLAQIRLPGVWQTVACLRSVSGRLL